MKEARESPKQISLVGASSYSNLIALSKDNNVKIINSFIIFGFKKKLDIIKLIVGDLIINYM
jgi:hypothetical protein